MAVKDHAIFFSVLRSLEDEQLFLIFRLIHQYQALAFGCIAAGAVAFREYFANLDAEMRTWKMLLEGRVMPARLAIILVRYSHMGSFIAANYFMFGPAKPSSCKPVFQLIYGLYCVLWGSAGSVFLMRLNIIFSGERGIMAFFVLLWSGGLAVWIYIATTVHAYPVAPAFQFPYSPQCMPAAFPRLGAVAWAGSIVFDSAVFLATLIRFRRVSRTKKGRQDGGGVQMRSRQWLFRSNLYYFGASMTFNLALMICSILVTDPLLSHMGSGFAFSIHTVMSTKLVYNTKGWTMAEADDIDDNAIYNTFNRNKRLGVNAARGLATSRITYTVDETVVTSGGGEFVSCDETQDNQGHDQRYCRHRGRNCNCHHDHRSQRRRLVETDSDNDDVRDHQSQTHDLECAASPRSGQSSKTYCHRADSARLGAHSPSYENSSGHGHRKRLSLTSKMRKRMSMGNESDSSAASVARKTLPKRNRGSNRHPPSVRIRNRNSNGQHSARVTSSIIDTESEIDAALTMDLKKKDVKRASMHSTDTDKDRSEGDLASQRDSRHSCAEKMPALPSAQLKAWHSLHSPQRYHPDTDIMTKSAKEACKRREEGRYLEPHSDSPMTPSSSSTSHLTADDQSSPPSYTASASANVSVAATPAAGGQDRGLADNMQEADDEGDTQGRTIARSESRSRYPCSYRATAPHRRPAV